MTAVTDATDELAASSPWLWRTFVPVVDERDAPDQVGGEAVFAPDPSSAAEDGGWVLNFVHDPVSDRSDVVVLDAGMLDEVARVHLPRRVSFGFHRSFFS